VKKRCRKTACVSRNNVLNVLAAPIAGGNLQGLKRQRAQRVAGILGNHDVCRQ